MPRLEYYTAPQDARINWVGFGSVQTTAYGEFKPSAKADAYKTSALPIRFVIAKSDNSHELLGATVAVVKDLSKRRVALPSGVKIEQLLRLAGKPEGSQDVQRAVEIQDLFVGVNRRQGIAGDMLQKLQNQLSTDAEIGGNPYILYGFVSDSDMGRYSEPLTKLAERFGFQKERVEKGGQKGFVFATFVDPRASTQSSV